MDTPIIDPLQGDFPEVIEEYLQHGVMKCIAFNRKGTLLAAGCANGSCIIWDFETRGIAKELRSEDGAVSITSVSWSKYGHRILVATADKLLILWDVATGKKLVQTTLEKTPLFARLHPGSSTSYLCLACPVHSAPLIVDLSTGTTKLLPTSLAESGDELSTSAQNKVSLDSALLTPACFNKYGDLVYVGNSKGEILIVDHHSAQVHAVVFITGAAVIKNIVFSSNGQYLLTNSSDRMMRVYQNMLPVKDALKALDKLCETLNDPNGVERLKAIGSECLVLSHEFQDSVTRIPWKAPCFSRNHEWIIAGSADKGEHKIYIWDRTGNLVKILEGPREALIDLAWHPVKPVIVSVSMTGLVYIWAKDYAENWSAFAPDFTEIEENEEYVEREDEFDIVPKTKKVKESDLDEDVDIISVEKDSTFSDTDGSQEELCFLPSFPCPGTPEQQELSAANHGLNSVEGVDDSIAEHTTRVRSKRRRKPTEILDW